MKHLHDNRTSVHKGREKTLADITRRFYWPGMSDDVSRWCKTCIPCAKGNPGPGKGKSPMQDVTVYGPMECPAIDIQNVLRQLQETINVNRFIMVVGYYFSKRKKAFALLEFLVDNIFVVFWPEKSSNRQSAFQWVRIVPRFSQTSFCIHTKRISYSLCSQ